MAPMSQWQVNAAEGAIYALSAAGLALCIVAAFFTWASLQKTSRDHSHNSRGSAAE